MYEACANTVVKNGTQTFVSWNQIANWLYHLEALRQESGAGANLSRYTQS